jgi:hypothetical protein
MNTPCTSIANLHSFKSPAMLGWGFFHVIVIFNSLPKGLKQWVNIAMIRRKSEKVGVQ